MIQFKAVTFVENGDIRRGHYFYNISLSDAIQKMKDNGIDPFDKKHVKMNIAVYYW